MACKEEKKEIGENEYYCRQWDAEKALVMKFHLGKIFGPAFTDLAVAIVEEDFTKASGAIGKLFTTSNSPETIVAFMKQVVEAATFKSKGSEKFQKITAANFNNIFSDNLVEFYKVFGFVLEVNYKNFFGEKLPAIMEKLKTAQGKLATEK